MKRTKRAVILALLTIACAALTLYSDKAAQSAAEAMRLCAASVIPALFPYMVISSLLVSSGAGEGLARLLPLSRLYALPDSASVAIVTGAVCGFPVGAASACELYRHGRLSKEAAETLIAVSNNTGPSFIVAVIGAGFWGSAAFGWRLYAFQLVSSLVAGLLINRLIMPPVNYSSSLPASHEYERLSVQFSRAVSGAAHASLNVCGFVVFFAVAICFCEMLFGDAAVYFSVLLEFTEGAALSAGIGGLRGVFLCGFTLGWSGISVFFQAASFALPLGLSLKRCLVTKLLQGVLCGVLTAVSCCAEAPKAFISAATPLISTLFFPLSVTVLLLFSLKTVIKR